LKRLRQLNTVEAVEEFFFPFQSPKGDGDASIRGGSLTFLFERR
jgi:hypothetical protein